MSRTRILVALLLTLSLVTAPSFVGPAQAANVEDCRISASQNQVVSLGFPVRAERLVNIPKPKILVVPFQLKDNPNFVFTASMKTDYLAAGENISAFSNGLTQVEFVFAPTIQTELTNADMDELKINQSAQWQKDESKSTYGFVRKFIADHDARLDFTGISGVILAGSSTSAYSDIAEAFMFWKNPDNPWFRPATTSEGPMNNFVLLDNHSTQRTITHEILHWYGLQDLYGTDTGPGRLSLMASNDLNLLSYEKWVLGWLPNTDVQCLTNLSQTRVTNFAFDNAKVNQVAVIRAPDNETYIVETSKANGRRYIAFYSLNNEARPPLTFFQERAQAQYGGILMEDHTVIGTQMRAPKFTLLVSNLDSSSVSLHLAPTSLVSSTEFKDLVTKSAEAKSKVAQENESKARIAAELKAKQEAEAKAAADKIAAEQLAASKAASMKKTTITCVKGKLTKKVTAVKPKCPSGYKKR
jgi:M6 family metalloprotease-like protein